MASESLRMVSFLLVLPLYVKLTTLLDGDTVEPLEFFELYSTNLSAITFMPAAVKRVEIIFEGADITVLI